MTADLFLGWDVGAWNCDQNPRSRDALCALEIRGAEPVIVGKVWRDNLRELLCVHEGSALVDAMLKLLDVDPDKQGHLTIAIDTPLAWPKPMIDLVTAASPVKARPGHCRAEMEITARPGALGPALSRGAWPSATPISRRTSGRRRPSPGAPYTDPVRISAREARVSRRPKSLNPLQEWARRPSWQTCVMTR